MLSIDPLLLPLAPKCKATTCISSIFAAVNPKEVKSKVIVAEAPKAAPVVVVKSPSVQSALAGGVIVAGP